jgi:hypothetical protein
MEHEKYDALLDGSKANVPRPMRELIIACVKTLMPTADVSTVSSRCLFGRTHVYREIFPHAVILLDMLTQGV